MKMKRYFYVFVLLCTFFSPMVFADTISTAGFIPGQIWYSKSSLIEGDTVRIYTAVWNGEDRSLMTHIDFYDKNVILGSRDIIIPSRELKEVYITWKITAGDHSISAKITSSNLINSNEKKESILLKNNSTKEDNQFVPVVVSTIDGNPATSSQVFKSQIDKVNSGISDVIPSSVRTPISNGINSVDNFRKNTSVEINETKAKTQKEIDSFNNPDNEKGKSINKNIDTGDAIKKPIAYVKLFFLSILGFIFNNKIVFYGLIIILFFIIIRSIYSKIRNRY